MALKDQNVVSGFASDAIPEAAILIRNRQSKVVQERLSEGVTRSAGWE
jgi:hypothetical protein